MNIMFICWCWNIIEKATDHRDGHWPVASKADCIFTPKEWQHFEQLLNDYQPKGGDALQLGSKGRYGSCVDG